MLLQVLYQNVASSVTPRPKSRMNYVLEGNATAATAATRLVNLPPIREAPPPGPVVQASAEALAQGPM
ncbi:conserved hypothetical protein [Ricinus communis]|uniref:Uncharacterized protein n=1 Tax=Ricinus communis TaxID=3988 RepID=B9SZX5_RICCO|nr:conserved hypothetical protein [Ricinus communis]